MIRQDLSLIHISVFAAVKAMSIAQSVSSGITALSSSIKNATAAANTVPKAASAMKGLAEAMKAASSSGAGLSGVLGSMIGPQGLIILGVAALGIFSAAVYKHLKKPVEDVKDGLSDMGESMADFYDDLSSAESHLSDFGTAFAALNDQQRELEGAAAEVQASITATLEKGVTAVSYTHLDVYKRQRTARATAIPLRFPTTTTSSM